MHRTAIRARGEWLSVRGSFWWLPLLGIILCAPLSLGEDQELDVQVRLRRQVHDGETESDWKQSIKAEALYPYGDETGVSIAGIPNERNLHGYNTYNTTVCNGIEVRTVGVDADGSIYLNGNLWEEGSWGTIDGWNYAWDAGVIWVWESAQNEKIAPREPLTVRFHAEQSDVEEGEEKLTDDASVTFYPPADIWGRRVSGSEGDWTLGQIVGQDVLVPPYAAELNAEVDGELVNDLPSRGTGRHLITLHSFVAATYRLRVMSEYDTGAAICRYFQVPSDLDAENWEEKEADFTEVTNKITSPEDAEKEDQLLVSVGADAHCKILLVTTPVGRNSDARHRRISVRIREISDEEIMDSRPDRYDAVTCSATSAYPPIRREWDEK